VIVLIYDRENIVAHWLPDVVVEVCFADVGFGGMDALQGGAGVENKAVGAVADDVSCYEYQFRFLELD
jgi:hypothetical protein